MNQLNDLNRDEEHNKNNRSIVSREAIYACLEKPMNYEDLFQALDAPSWSYDAALKRVNAMVRDHQLADDGEIISRLGESKLVKARAFMDKANQLHVKIDGVDIILTERHAQGVFSGDELLLRVPQPVKPDSIAVMIKIHEINKNHIVCFVKEQRGKIRLMSFDNKLKQHLVFNEPANVDADSVITVTRVEKQSSKRFLNVKLGKVLGTVDTPGIERVIARHLFKLSPPWPEVSVDGATQSDIDAQLSKRTSWVDIPLVTIDGSDAKDYDDAVAVEKTDQGYRLYVAIADVAHYVSQDSELDKEARKRGNSVYFPGHVIPMLPEILSNDICSLVPEKNRLALGLCADFDHNGNRTNLSIDRVVIRSHSRLIYEDVDSMLSGDLPTPEFWKSKLEALDALSKVLRARRVKEGTILLSSVETNFIFDDQGIISDLQTKERGWSNQMIEECMLAANMAVGYHLNEINIPIIYRNHHEPTAEKVAQFQDYLKSLQIDLPSQPSPKDLQDALDACKNRPDYKSVEMMVLRTLSQAYYGAEEVGHYALSTRFYTHFTSPIRRYVDLTVHRQIHAWLDKKSIEMDLDKIAESCSGLERKADEASWFSHAWLKAKWMKPNVGETYLAKVSSVTHFGLFVTIEGLPIEGLIHISNLGNEYFVHNSEFLTLEGKSSGMIYTMGQSLQVRLKSVNVLALQIDFEAVY